MMGAELGHTKLAYHGSSCTCGQLGCAEAYCSATALIRQAKEELTKETADRMKGSVMYELYGNDLDRLDAKMVVDAYKMGDRIAKKEKNIMKKPEKKAADMTVKELASYIDYSVLKPEFTEEEIIDLTKDGVKLGCATICINPGYMELCEPYVKGSETMLCPVKDFRFGTSSTESRVQQIENVAKYDTVKEVDIVINYGKLRSGKVEEIVEDLKACVAAAHKYGREFC